MTPEVFRITDYGGGWTQNLSGGRNTEFYAVVGLGPYEKETAHGLGLPRVGTAPTDVRIGFAGTVVDVSLEREYPPDGLLYRVTYNTTGTFNFSTLLGSALRTGTEYIDIPVMTPIDTAGNGYVLQLRPFRRGTFTKVVSARLNMPMQQAANIVATNRNKVYSFTGVEYQLEGASMVQDASMNVRIDTYFSHRHLIRGWPEGYWVGAPLRSKEIPTLQPNGIYSWNTIVGDVSVRDALDMYGVGEVLPWIT